MITVVVSTKNNSATLAEALEGLVPAAIDGLVRQVIVTDGGSLDATTAIADAAGADIVDMPGSTAARLNASAAQARFPWLMFLPPHARLAPDFEREVTRYLAADGQTIARFKPVHEPLGIQARVQRSASRGLDLLLNRASSGDCLLIRRATFTQLGGFTGADCAHVAQIGLAATRIVTLDAIVHIATSQSHVRSQAAVRSGLRSLLGGKSATQSSAN